MNGRLTLGMALLVCLAVGTVEARGIPRKAGVGDRFEVTGGPRQFRTPHFEFETARDVTRGFVKEASLAFEGTRAALMALPLPIDPEPPGDLTHFQCRILEGPAFRAALPSELQRTRSAPGSKRMVAGVYLPASQEVLVPFESLGATERGDRMNLRRFSDTSTLIHEITHQLMHDWLPVTPVWVVEGLAEYMAAVPFDRGEFTFWRSFSGLKRHLRDRYGQARLHLIHPADLMRDRPEDWTWSQEEYLAALLMVYYFLHLDGEGQGEALGAYLRLLDEARDETSDFVARHNQAVMDFRKEVEAYNRAVAGYNDALQSFRREVLAFESRRQLLGEAAADLEPPAPPVPPARPEPPGILSEHRGGGDIDLYAIATRRGLPALLRGRDFDEFGRDFTAAYHRRDLPVSLRLRRP